jgi:hypothetical protein
MNRRDLIALLGTTAVSWPLGVRAQQGQHMRRIGVLMNLVVQALSDLGWKNANNVQIDTCWGAGDTGRGKIRLVESRKIAKEKSENPGKRR